MDLKVLRNTQVIILGVCIAAATLFSSVILSRTFMKIMQRTREVITVTGAANKQITSDYAVWRASFTVRDADLASAYRRLNVDLAKVKQYLAAKGVDARELEVPPIVTEQLYKKDSHGNDTNEFQEYRLTQAVEIHSERVEKVAQLSREITALIDQGIQLNSGKPEYLYRKLDELKVEMLARATENAKQRAENMAKAAGNRISVMRFAKMGVFQITPIYSNDVSDYGINDTSSLEKKVTAVVNAAFAIE
jgi:hypothetical protein